MKRFISTGILAIMALIFVLALSSVVSAEVSKEHAVKAAMVRNFAKFTRWPKNSLSGRTNDTISVCLMGDESLLESFTGIRGKKIGGRSITLRWINNITGLQGCDLLFVDKTTRSELSRIMESLRNKPVLTIGETKEFTRSGGMITFFIQDNRIRFRINPQAARRSGLNLSSSLLELATIVHSSIREHQQ